MSVHFLIAAALTVLAIPCDCRGEELPDQSKAISTASSDTASSDTSDNEKKKDETKKDPRRTKMIATFSRKLGGLRPIDSPRKSLQDFWVFGTADLKSSTGHADVCFQAKQGQVAVAEFLVDYQLGAAEDYVRQWHVFYRAQDAQQAEQVLQMIRSQYDQLAAYRENIRKQYKAKTVRRC